MMDVKRMVEEDNSNIYLCTHVSVYAKFIKGLVLHQLGVSIFNLASNVIGTTFITK